MNSPAQEVRAVCGAPAVAADCLAHALPLDTLPLACRCLDDREDHHA